MQNKKNILAALTITFSIFFSIVYTSCNKHTITSVDKCKNMVCKNGGVCNVGICSCPTGYEDADCGSASVDRYVGTWTLHDSVIGSDHAAALHASNTYTVTITANPGSPATFFINGITGDPGFQNLPCRMQDTLTRLFDPMEFRSTDLYGYSSPSHLVIVSWIGVVNIVGNYIHGHYIKQYPVLADSTSENDTLVYNAFRQ